MKLIVEMEMPKNMCCDCEISIDGFACKKARANGGKCPIVGVLPDEHGDLIDRSALMRAFCNHCDGDEPCTEPCVDIGLIETAPTVDAVPVPDGGIGELSDGYHTFNGLYYQRMMLFATLVKTYKDRAWKSRRHSDGEPCFGGGWFIVGIDTPQGGYTYHYEDKYFDLFDCVELPNGKEWDGHTEDDVTRLLTLCADGERRSDD